jgi:hypothetical protein
MTHQFHFTSSSIAPEKVDALAEAKGYDTRAAYLRALIREDAQRQDMEL